MSERRVQMMCLRDIKPNPDNVKEHELDGVGASIGRLGLIDLPVLDERTGMLVAGHGRIEALTAARDAGQDPPEGVEVATDDVERIDWRVPVLRGWPSRDDDEARAAAIALNAWVARGGWDVEGLTAILRRLSETDGGLVGVGYSDRDLSDLLKSTEQWDGEGGAARREASIDELAENYRNKQVRTLVLDYPLSDYRRVVELAAAARKRYGVEGNAELMMALVRRWDQANPAD